MSKVSCITPHGQVTIPRSVMKSLGIGEGCEIIIEVDNGRLILKKAEDDSKKEDINPGVS